MGTSQSADRIPLKAGQIELARYKLLIESIQDYAIFLMDKDGYIMTWNKGAERNKGYKDHEIIGRHFSAFYTQQDIDAGKPERELRIAAKVGRIEDEDWRIRKDGSRFWANVVITALYDGTGELVGYAKVTRNLTERKRQEDELRQANTLLRRQQQELKRLNEAKDEFISLASHQLRTPATAVKLILGSMLDELYGELDPKMEPLIQKAYDSNERQINIVNNMLRVAQLDAGKVVLRKESLNINTLMAGIIDEQSDTVTSKKQTMNLDHPDHPVMVSIDQQNLRMAFSNLIENASKYSFEGGTITVTIQPTPSSVVVAIRDTGVGIAPEDVARLFNKFVRLQNALSQKVSGSGLGLFWAKQIVELHGGVIEVQSHPGSGTTFRVTLPGQAANA